MPNKKRTDCAQFVKLAECGVVQIKTAFSESLLRNDSVKKVGELKNLFVSIISKYEREIDNVKRSLGQTYSDRVTTLKIELRNVTKFLDDQFSGLEKNLRRLCVSEIKNGNVPQALAYFQDLPNSSFS